MADDGLTPTDFDSTDQPDEPDTFFADEAIVEEAPVPSRPRFCTKCGTAFDDNGVCAWCASGVTYVPRGIVEPAAPSIGPALALYFVLLGTFIFVVFGDEGVTAELAITIADAVIVALWALFSGRRILGLFRLPPNAWWLLAPIGVGVATFVFVSAFFWFIESAFGIVAELYTPAYLDAGYGLGVIVLSICVQPALIEELAFRGIIFDGLKGGLSLKEAMVVSSLMFAALHLSPLAFPHTFAIGMIAAWMVVRTGSLWPGIVLHFTHNFLCIAQELWWS